jgi:hypothetical protein
LSREVIQVYLNDLAADEERIRLSDCAPSRARQYLAKAVRHPLVIREGIDLFVRELDLRQRVNPDAAGLVFSCSDSPGESNQHAREIAAVIAEVKPDYQCCIVTMKSLEGDETSTKQIERFVGVDGGQGKGDVLIVKQMGGAGLDPPRVKVLLDLSPVRTVASVIQRLMRVATPWAGIKTASVITLADPLMDAIWQRYVVEEGGEAMSSTSDVDMDFVRSYLVEKGGEGPEPLLAIVSAEICAFDNNFGQVGELTNLGLVNALIGRVPSLTNWHTKAELSDMLAGFVVPPEAVKPVPALRTTIENKQAAINARVKDLAQRESPYNPTNTGPFIERCKYWMNGAKRAAGVSLAVKLDDIVNTTTLDVMLNFLAK